MWTPSYYTVTVISTIALTVGVIVSLFLGKKSLRKTEEIQGKQFTHSDAMSKREHQSKLLDEIIEFAIDCARLGIKHNRGVVMRAKRREPNYLLFEESAFPYLEGQMEEVEEYQILRAKTEYILCIVPANAEVLVKHIKALRESLRQQLNILHELKVSWRERKSLLDDAGVTYLNNISIYDKATEVLKEAASIKKSHWI